MAALRVDSQVSLDEGDCLKIRWVEIQSGLYFERDEGKAKQKEDASFKGKGSHW